MKLTIGGETKNFKDDLTVAELLAEEKVQNPEYVTVAVNDEFVDGPLESRRVLVEGDHIEFLYFMGGGRPWPSPTNN
ncbi:MAG: sulfur carrier protein ThiS [Deltaproteobacteria bacterium]|jgi:sulfur carrier protein|nr:sulfur carrier protein ThiS [Deltaproteobacteria bacterium]